VSASALPTPLLGTVINLTGAALAGLAVGVEREWSGHASGPTGRFAGVRTFLLLGLLGGLAGWAIDAGILAVAVTLLAGGLALSVVAYANATRRPRAPLDGTTEVAALVVLALGVVAGRGDVGLACGVAAVVVLALSEKTRIQQLLRRIGDRELRAAVRFAVMSLVVLPVIPSTPRGPGGVGPRTLWALVVLFSGLNFAGYLARRVAGAERGHAVTGLLGGLVSSTAVTLQFSRASRRDRAEGSALAVGVVGACTVLVARIALTSAALNRSVAVALVPFLAPVALAGLVAIAFGYSRVRTDAPRTAPTEDGRSPLRVRSALQLAALFLAATTVTAVAQRVWGAGGVLTSAAALGAVDIDALTVSMSRMGTTPAAAALGARGVAIGLLADTALKLGIVLALGAPGFRRRAAAGLAALTLAAAAGLWLGSVGAIQQAVGALLDTL